MGCDIHIYIEYLRGDKWWNFGSKINPGRNYDIFTAFANVRGSGGLKPKDLPKQIGWKTEDDNTLYISKEDTDYEGYVTPERAERWVKEGASKYFKEHWVTHPDWHSHSWLTTEEYEKIIKNFLYEEEYQAVLACLKSFENSGKKARIVFWFDN